MNIVKSILTLIPAICIGVVKLPITILDVLFQGLDICLSMLIGKYAKWSGDENLIDGAKCAYRKNSWSCMVISDMFDELEEGL